MTMYEGDCRFGSTRDRAGAPPVAERPRRRLPPQGTAS